MSEAIEAVSLLIACYPNGERVSNSYIGIVAKLFMQYPKSIALACADPIRGIAIQSKFVPAIAELVAWLEKAKQPLEKAAQWDRGARRQLDERRRIEETENTEPIEQRRAAVDRVKRELRAAGLRFRDDRKYHGETRQTVMAKLGMTEAEFEALPDVDLGKWERLRANYGAAGSVVGSMDPNAGTTKGVNHADQDRPRGEHDAAGRPHSARG